ncbi:hypothetical protein Q4543_23790, partial [Salipiger sp. 1_MG-2023]|uniref:hypothetical protein n=1 Tax=Salipiger sp. 1_MG-2023 TaxID=3062665 RepID=UPI0026E11B39
MARPRTPMAKAKLTGADKAHPERFRNRFNPKGEQPVGDPPSFMSAKEKAAWRDFARRWPWLTAADEPALVALAQLRALIEDPKKQKTAALYTAYRLAINEFGGTSVSRSKVHAPVAEEEDDPFAKFEMQ